MKDLITIRGFVATEVTSSTTTGGTATASFRVGVTSRRFDEPTKSWVDGHTNWFTVKGYRQLAGTIGCSIRKGQPVIVVGRLKLSTWEKDGRVYHSTIIDAVGVGHDLTFGSANFTRTSSKPVLSLVEPPRVPDNEHPGVMDEPMDEPEDHEEGQPDDDGHPSVVIEDSDGGIVSLDLETGELAESGV
ncbi:single-stranded DNA-binding protein [Arthrobacter sp. MPF02]|uniref:single-stranded DNA-binding protein n=1 Tax=Arthrobacter sp. MPF02 TaxID=3388492 RepID=UPI0039855081